MNFCQKDFGARLRDQRKALHMTQEELARKVFADAQHVGRIERGEKSVSIDLLIELSQALHVSTDYLLIGKESKNEIREQLTSVIGQLFEIVGKV